MSTNGRVNSVVSVLSCLFYIQPNCYGAICNAGCRSWDITHITSPGQTETNSKYAVLILNRPIPQNAEFIRNLWNNAAVRITVDGGTSRWDSLLSTWPEDIQSAVKIPDLITGDFDSITEDVLQKYTKKGCKVIPTPDQNYTDFTKALMELKTYSEQNSIEIEQAIAIGQASGRFDQIMGNVQTLFLAKKKNYLPETTTLYLMSDDSISWLLYPGGNTINIPEETRKHRKAWCSLVPIGEPCASVTTSGLKWNLDNQELRFGEIVSTSNTFSGSEQVTVNCSHPILWSMKVPSLLNK